MSLTQEAALTFTIFCLISATAFLGWLLWHIVWEAYDSLIAHLAKRSLRVPYSEINEHRITPSFSMKDFK